MQPDNVNEEQSSRAKSSRAALARDGVETESACGSSGGSCGLKHPVTEHQNLPPGEPVPATMRAAFDSERDALFAEIRRPQRTLHANEE